MRVAVYARYSSENQREASIEDQTRNCEKRATQEGWSVTHRYQDKAISGSTNVRPGYQQLLADAEAKCFDIVLVDDFSRLSRDQVESEQVRRRMVHWGCRLIGVTDGIDTASKGHKLQAGMKGLMNDIFLDDLRERTHRGMVGQALKGYHCGGRAYGYVLVPELHPTKLDPYGQPTRIGTRLEQHPEQASVVRWIFERFADCWSPLKIVEDLNRRRVPPPGAAFRRHSTHTPTWCASALHGDVHQGTGLLNNPLYNGQHIWGRARWEKHPDTKKKTRVLRDRKDWIITPAPHLKIIDDALWARVKARQAVIHNESAGVRAALKLRPTMSTGCGPKYLFSSLLICAQCGHKFIIVDPRHYGCGGWQYRGQSVCSNTIKVSRAIVESVLLSAIQRDLFTEEGFMVFKQEVARLLAERRSTQIPDRERLHAKLAEVEREIAYIMKAIKAGILTVSTKAELEKAEAERGRLLSQLQARTAKGDNVTTMLPNLKERFKTLVGNLAATPHHHVAKAREALKSLLGKTIALHPCADGAGRYLTAEVTGDYEGLLRLAIGKNKAGGGQGS